MQVQKIKSAIFKTRLIKQTSLLFSSDFSATILGLFTGIINTRFLGKEGYGKVAFIYAVINISSLFFNFGLFNAGSRCLAKTEKNSDAEKELIGVLLFITGLILTFYVALIFAFSLFIDQVFHSDVNHVFRVIPILALAYPMEQLLYQICQGTNNIIQMAFFKIIPKLAYLILVPAVLYYTSLTAQLAVTLNLGTMFLAVLIIFWRFHPSLHNFKRHWQTLWAETRSYGFHVYLGRLSSLATFDSTKLLISYFGDTTATGFYNLALLLSSPMVMLSRALSISLFKSFLPERKVSVKVTKFNLGWLVLASAFLIIFGKYVIQLLYGAEYAPAYPLLVITAVATLFRGLIQPYNLFMGAKGYGKQLRNTAFILTGSILVFNFGMIPIWGAIGAALASLFALFVNYLVHLHYYRKVILI